MSKSYSFSLQKVFDFRKRIEEKQAVDLSLKSKKLKNELTNYDTLEAKKEKIFKKDQEKKSENNVMELNNLKLQKDYIIQVNYELLTQQQKVDEANNEVNESRDKLKKATKDKKILERLNEKKLEEYKKELKLQSNKNDNEIAGRIALANKVKRLSR